MNPERAARISDTSDTIAAIATATGGGVGIIRVSGPAAISVTNSCFVPTARAPAHRVATLGHLHAADGSVLDHGLLLLFKGPRSLTGEDVVELHLHGGRAHLEACLDVVLAAGARMARPGEFLERAFHNDKLDLTRAEAIADLVTASTDRAAKAARAHLQGGLADRTLAMIDETLRVLAAIEVNIDFIDEDVPLHDPDALATQLDRIAADARALAGTFASARLLREGARVVLAGPPNAGKSSLFNALCGFARAIVTPLPGTTRDTLVEALDLGGVPVLLTDTAGLRETDDVVERAGIDRTEQALDEADLVLVVAPPRADASAWDRPEALAVRPSRVVHVFSKADLLPADAPLPSPGVRVSAETGEGLGALRDAIVQALGLGAGFDETLSVSRVRHRDALLRATMALERAAAGLRAGETPELPAVDLQEALGAFGELTGRVTPEDMLDRLFATFCIGK